MPKDINKMSEEELLDYGYNLEIKYKEIENKRKEYQEYLKIIMKDLKEPKMQNDLIKIVYTKETKRISFDGKKLEKEQPEIYSRYEKEIIVSPSVRISLC